MNQNLFKNQQKQKIDEIDLCLEEPHIAEESIDLETSANLKNRTLKKMNQSKLQINKKSQKSKNSQNGKNGPQITKRITKSKKNDKNGRKYPGVTFLKSKIKIDKKASLGQVKELSDQDCRRMAIQEENKRIKRRNSRQNRRQKERVFRYNLEKAFDVDQVEIIPVD